MCSTLHARLLPQRKITMLQLCFCFALNLSLLWCLSSASSPASLHNPPRTLSPRAHLSGCTQHEQQTLTQAFHFLELLALNAQDATDPRPDNIMEEIEFINQFSQYFPTYRNRLQLQIDLRRQRLLVHGTAKRVLMKTIETLRRDLSYPDRLYIHCDDVERRCVEGNHAAAYLMRWAGPDNDEYHVALVRFCE